MALMKRVDRGGKIYGARKNNRKSAHDSTWAYKLGFWCLNPGIIFQDMCAKTKSVILTSGTLSPVSLLIKKLRKKNIYIQLQMDTFASELDTKL
jgi:Rad3-related DNA helicase